MALLATQTLSNAYAGVAITRDAADVAGDLVPNPRERLYLAVVNGGGSPIDVTIVVPGTTWNNQATPDTVETIAAGEERWLPILAAYSDGNLQASVTYTDVTNVTVAVVAT